MKVVCINNKPVINKTGGLSRGEPLIEGEVYTVLGHYIGGLNNDLMYFISELNDTKYAFRFRPTDESLTEIENSIEKVSINNL